MKDNCGNFDKKVPGVEVSGLPAGAKDMLAKAHPDIQKALLDLRKHERQVLAAFKGRPELAARFVTDPASVLAALEIPVDSQLRARLKSAPLQPDFLKPRAFCLPPGKTLNAKVRVSIVSGAPDRNNNPDDDNNPHHSHHHPQQKGKDEKENTEEAARRK